MANQQELPVVDYLDETRNLLKDNFLADNRPWVVVY